MPCGGIYPKPSNGKVRCFYCADYGCNHFMEEWDAFVHAKCVIAEIQRENVEVGIIIQHRHTIILDFEADEG